MKNKAHHYLQLFFFLFFVLSNSFTVFAQKQVATQNHQKIYSYYGSTGGGVVLEKNALPAVFPGIAFTILYQNKWGGSISYHFSAFQSRFLPNDYKPGFSLFGESSNPPDVLKAVAIRAIRQFQTSRPKLKLGVEAGPDLLFFSVVYYTKRPPSNSFFNFSNDYDIRTEESASIGLSFRAKARWQFNRLLGMEVALLSGLNLQQNYVGAEVLFTIGRQ